MATKKASKKKSSTAKKSSTRRSTSAKKSSSKKRSLGRKYSPSSGKNVETEMREMKKGKLKSGRSGKKVTNPKQAIAIGLSKARKEGPRKEEVAASFNGSTSPAKVSVSETSGPVASWRP